MRCSPSEGGSAGAGTSLHRRTRRRAPVLRQARFLRPIHFQELRNFQERIDLVCHIGVLRWRMTTNILRTLSEDQLSEEVKRLAGCERRATAALIRALDEFDARKLYLREGCYSLFTYCTLMLHLSEASGTTGSRRSGPRGGSRS